MLIMSSKSIHEKSSQMCACSQTPKPLHLHRSSPRPCQAPFHIRLACRARRPQSPVRPPPYRRKPPAKPKALEVHVTLNPEPNPKPTPMPSHCNGLAASRTKDRACKGQCRAGQSQGKAPPSCQRLGFRASGLYGFRVYEFTALGH